MTNCILHLGRDKEAEVMKETKKNHKRNEKRKRRIKKLSNG